jgi:hypothetical protein
MLLKSEEQRKKIYVKYQPILGILDEISLTPKEFTEQQIRNLELVS